MALQFLFERNEHMAEIILNNGCVISRLSENDQAAVSALCISCEDYFHLHCGVFSADREVDGIFHDLPPGKDYADKFVLGVFDPSGRLVGLIDVIRDYVVKGEWMIGLMLLDPSIRKIGLGKAVHNALLEWAKGLGAKSFRIGVIEENTNGHAFWTALGYKKLKAASMTLTNKTHIINVMTLSFSE